MGNNVLKVSTTELSDLAKTLKSTSDNIYNTYKSQIVGVLESSQDCFYVSGLDSASIIDSFNDIYTTLNSQIELLVDILNNRVIPGYDELMKVVSGQFNSDFSAQLQELLPNISKVSK